MLLLLLLRTRYCLPRSKVPYRLSSSTTGPRKEKVRAIPFRQHVKAADQTFEDYHGSGFFSVRLKQAGRPQEVFLPFWVVSARVHAEIVQAQVGKTVLRTRYDPVSKRNEPRFETVWSWVPDRPRWTKDYVPGEHVGLHIYGSHKYRRGLVNCIRSTQSLQDATAFEPDRLFSGNDQRTIDPFMLYPSTALRLAKAYIQKAENDAADAWLRRTYGADQTRLVQVKLHLENVQVSPIYYPVFVYTVQYLGRNLRTFVNGNDLSVGGMRVYNWNRVAAVSAATMATVMTMTGGIGWGGISGSFWLGVVLPTLATSLLAVYFPIISLRVRDMIRQHEIRAQAQDMHTWDTDWVKAYNVFEEQTRYRAWKTESEYRRFGQFGTHDDPRGYYRTLGVGPKATTAEIQSAFRRLAMKNHPDRYSHPEEKRKATEEFQRISAAYSVLRDPKKRKSYDRTGNA